MKSPKPCRVCNSDFEITEPALKKGNYICKACRKDASRKNFLSRKERGLKVSGKQMDREYHRKYAEEYRTRDYVKVNRIDSFNKRMLDSQEVHKYNARKMVRNAIRRGELIRLPCEVCGSSPAQGHHEDYNKPLDVIWLCPVHHTEVHAKAREETL